MDSKPQNINCHYCLSQIKKSEEYIICPLCNSVYHRECWDENSGCAVYGCRNKIQISTPKNLTVKDILTNIEFLINKRKYSDAIVECNRILSVDPENTDVKILHNQTSKIINIRIQLLENADDAYSKKDFKTAEVFYRNALGYLDEEEYLLVQAKLEAIKSKIPAMIRRRKFNFTLISVLILIIFSLIGFTWYFYIYLQEDREFDILLKNEKFENISSIEKQIQQYEGFLRKYPEGKNYVKTKDRIGELAGIAVMQVYKEDWKLALKYLGKIDEKLNYKSYRDLSKAILSEAEKELNEKIDKAKKYNVQKKFVEAKKELEKALSVINSFTDSDLSLEKSNIESGLSLINKKLSYLIKYKDIEKEIGEKFEELKKYEKEAISVKNLLKAKILTQKSPTLFIISINQGKEKAALRTIFPGYEEGENVEINCENKGKITLMNSLGEEEIFTLYKEKGETADFNLSLNNKIEKESLSQRLNYLKEQKNRLDSLLNLPL